MYESPIEMIVKDIQLKQEDSIFKAIQECNISVDREELLKALQYDRGQYEKGYADRDAEIVRCKDCVNCTHLVYEYDRCEEWWCGAKEVLPDGFCNDGKRRDDERYD